MPGSRVNMFAAMSAVCASIPSAWLPERIPKYPEVALGTHQDHDWYYIRVQWHHARQAGPSQGSRLLGATLSDR